MKINNNKYYREHSTKEPKIIIEVKDGGLQYRTVEEEVVLV